MNLTGSLLRKIAYLAALVVLAIPIVWLGSPSTRDESGGKLAQLRTEARLGQADIGAIDPASETIRLATLGLRGPAVTMLWNKANEFKKTEDWTTFQTTLEQLARLQPYFIKVWQHQAWNLTYNVSVELDNVRDRFYYVKQGIQYLQEGIGYNRDNPTLLDDLGWFTGNKVGRADEHELYRKMYKLDDDLNSDDIDPALRDNWLASKRWYEQAIRAIDELGQPLGTKNPVTFFDSSARSQLSYGEAIETEGIFGRQAEMAWREGAKLWNEYGTREMPSTDGDMIRLADNKLWEDKAKQLRGELDALSPGLEGKLREEALDELTPEQRKVYEQPPANPTSEEAKLQQEVSEIMDITLDDLAARLAKDQPENAAKARRLAQDIHDAERRLRAIESSRDVANYEYWRIRADLEQAQEALDGHRLAHEAKRQFEEKADPEGAKDLYERSFDAWAKALAKFPELPADSSTGSDLMDVVEEYVKVLETMELDLSDSKVDKRFALWNIVEANDQMRKFDEAIEAHKARAAGKPAPSPSGATPKTLVDPADALIK